MKKIYFYSFLVGFILGLFGLLVGVSDFVTKFLHRFDSLIQLSGWLSGSVSILVYLGVLTLPLVTVFLLVTFGLWKFINSIRLKYTPFEIIKVNIFFVAGVYTFVIVLSIIFNFLIR